MNDLDKGRGQAEEVLVQRQAKAARDSPMVPRRRWMMMVLYCYCYYSNVVATAAADAVPVVVVPTANWSRATTSSGVIGRPRRRAAHVCCEIRVARCETGGRSNRDNRCNTTTMMDVLRAWILEK